MYRRPIVTLIGNGDRVTIDGVGSGFTLKPGMTGTGIAPVEVTFADLVGGGSILRHRRNKNIEITIPIDVFHGYGDEAYRKLEDSRRRFEHICDGLVEIRIETKDGFRSAFGYLDEGLEGDFSKAVINEFRMILPLTFICPDPWWYGELRNSGDGQRLAEGTVVRENLNTNPRFSEWHTIDTLGQNWVLNPEAQSGTGAYWARQQTHGMSIQPAKYMPLRQGIIPGVNQAWGYTATAGPSLSYLLLMSSNPADENGAPVVAGDVVVGGALIYSSRAGSVAASIAFYDAAGSMISAPNGSFVSIAAGGVQWVSVRTVAPAGAVFAYLRAGLWQDEHQYPYTVAASAGLLMTSNDVQGQSDWVPSSAPGPSAYFSGNRSVDPDFKLVGWSGDEGASVSQLRLARPTAQGDPDDGAAWGGMGSARISTSNRGGIAVVSDGVNTASVFPSGAFADGAQERLKLFPGTTHLFSVDTSLDETLPAGDTSGLARRISVDVQAAEGTSWGYAQSAPLPNEAGASERLTVLASIPADATDAQVRLMHGHTSGRIRFDNFLHLQLPNAQYPSYADLGSWFAALSGANEQQAQMMLIGDSISEGLRLERAEDRWQSRTQATLRAVTGARRGAAFPFIPGYFNTGFDEGERYHPLATEGNVTRSSIRGMSARTLLLDDVDAAVTFKFVGTSAILHFENGGEDGVARVIVNGKPEIVVIQSLEDGVLPFENLMGGGHRIRVEKVSGTVAVGGVTTYDRDETRGLRIIDGARSGMATSHIFDPTRAEAYQRYMRVTGPYQLVVVALGTNDYTGEPVDSGSNMSQIIDVIRAVHSGTILILGCALGRGRDPEVWEQFESAWRAAADSHPDVVFASVREGMPDGAVDSRLYADSLHPNSDGHAVMSGVVSSIIGLQAPGVFDSFFSGATRPDNGKACEWVGAVNASTSLERSPDLLGMGAPSYPYWPVELSYSSNEETFVLDVTGDAKSWPTWVISPPGKDVLVVNQTTGERIDIRGGIDEEITIVTTPQQQDMITETKRDGQTWLKATSDTVLFPLAPGPNVVAISIVNGDARSQISATYRETFKAGH